MTGAATAVGASSWQVTKFALPQVNFNNPHNMWTDRRQQVIYDTEWFGTALAAFDRRSGRLVAHTEVGEAPAHVMTRTDTDQVHVTLNGKTRSWNSARARKDRSPDPRPAPWRAGRPTPRPLDERRRPGDGDAELQHQRLDPARRPRGDDHGQAGDRHPADRGRDDARHQQVLRLQLPRQHHQRRGHGRPPAGDQDDQPARQLRPHRRLSPGRSRRSPSRRP